MTPTEGISKTSFLIIWYKPKQHITSGFNDFTLNGTGEATINKSGITIRMKVAQMRVMGRATQGVRLINLKKGDEIAAVAYVAMNGTDENEEGEENNPDVSVE